MDRLDAMAAFLATADEGSLAAAARRLGWSRASITRAVALLEERTGAHLLHRTTRVVRLTPAGETFLGTCRRILAELGEAEGAVAGERAALAGVLTLTAPATFGRIHVRPVVEKFLQAHPEARVRLLLLDRVVNLVDEGVDAAVRIGKLPDSSLTALRVGDVRRITCASPAYLARHGEPARPADLPAHHCIAFSQEFAGENWSFGKQHIKLRPKLTVNSADTAIDSALEGRGITRVLSYQAEPHLRGGRLVRVLTNDEPPALPVHLVTPQGRNAGARVRAFLDLASPVLRAVLKRIEAATGA